MNVECLLVKLPLVHSCTPRRPRVGTSTNKNNTHSRSELSELQKNSSRELNATSTIRTPKKKQRIQLHPSTIKLLTTVISEITERQAAHSIPAVIPLSPRGKTYLTSKIDHGKEELDKGKRRDIGKLNLEEIDSAMDRTAHFHRTELEIDVPVFTNPFADSERAPASPEPDEIPVGLVQEAYLEAAFMGRKFPIPLYQNLAIRVPKVHSAIQDSWRAKELLLKNSGFLQ